MSAHGIVGVQPMAERVRLKMSGNATELALEMTLPETLDLVCALIEAARVAQRDLNTVEAIKASLPARARRTRSPSIWGRPVRRS